MKSREEIAETVRGIFEKILKIEPARLQPATRFKEDLSLDSLDMIEVVYAVEDAFDVQIPEERMKEIRSFGQIVEGLEAALQAKAPPG